MRIERFILVCQERVNRLLQQALPAITSEPQCLHQAIHYAVLNGGKRVRPTLLYAVAEALNISWHKLDAAACAIEMIHAYSLVHDDLPAMDNDTYRRGKLSCHKAFDEATAILVGDALQSLAFQLLSEHEYLSANQRIKQIQILAKASGSQGMVGGQVLDLAGVGQKLTVEQLDAIHHWKTGALLRACVELAVVISESDEASRQLLLAYGTLVGIAFQIRDDVLDYQQALANRRGEASYTLSFSIEEAEQRLQQLEQQSCEILQKVGLENSMLQSLTELLTKRRD